MTFPQQQCDPEFHCRKPAGLVAGRFFLYPLHSRWTFAVTGIRQMAKLALMWGPIYHPALPGDNQPQPTDAPAGIRDIPESRLEGGRVMVNTSRHLFWQVGDQSWPSIRAGNFSDLPMEKLNHQPMEKQGGPGSTGSSGNHAHGFFRDHFHTHANRMPPSSVFFPLTFSR